MYVDCSDVGVGKRFLVVSVRGEGFIDEDDGAGFLSIRTVCCWVDYSPEGSHICGVCGGESGVGRPGRLHGETGAISDGSSRNSDSKSTRNQ